MKSQELWQCPFSRFGSYIAVTEHRPDSPRKPANLTPGVWIIGVHGFLAARDIFRVALWKDGMEVPFTVERHPSHLVFRSTAGTAELCIAETELLRIRCRGVGVRLMLREAEYNYIVEQPGPRWLINTAQAFLLFTAYPQSGTFRVDGQWDKAKATNVTLVLDPPATGEAEVALHQHVGFTQPRAIEGTFDQAVAAVGREFDAFVRPYRKEGSPWAGAIEQAALLNWSCVVGPRGHFRRPSMLMSKNWMCNVWSWDHAINALALAEHHPALAWDQLLTIFDHQLPNGQPPDFINDAVRLYNYIKTPIHGWILAQMLQRNAWFNDAHRLTEFYAALESWTRWWLEYRIHPTLGLPEYYHGNDCWDNATFFDAGVPLIGPGAASFLILQMETLADLARRLRKVALAQEWLAKAQEMQSKLLEHLWDGRQFVARTREGKIAERSDSVYRCQPIILGPRLPTEIRAALVREIRRHLTPWGLATEHPDSPLYEPKGYWRGPIWAPPTLIIVEGLHAAGEEALALDIARRFCHLCQQAGAFAENFDALTGAPLCDPAYTWTASVFLEMARRAGANGTQV